MDTLSTRSRPTSQGSSRFRESVHLIPTPGVEQKRPKRFEPIVLKVWVVISIALFMVGLAVGLEVALHFSYQNNGFGVPQQNVFSFISTQFLTSFLPILFIGPLAILWSVTDWMLRWYQPYVTLSKGYAPAEESLLLDYIALNKVSTLLVSFKHKHWLLHVSSITALVSLLLQPLSGSIFQIRQLPVTQDANVTSTQTIGLSPNVNDLNAFSASAGYVSAAVFNNLDDPPFVCGGWSTAEFVFPNNPVLNGSMMVNTTGVQTAVNCFNPSSVSVNSTGSTNYTINSVSAQGCTQAVTFNPASSNQQYGVTGVPNCGTATDVTFQPIMFWYFHLDQNNKPEARTVFCHPTIKLFNVMAFANLNNGSLVNVTIVSNYPTSNNVTGSPLSGEAFNGVTFDTNPDPFVTARSISINNGVPGAIFRQASQEQSGLQSVFGNTNGFLAITEDIYTQYLAIASKSIYLLPTDQVVPAKMTSLINRLWIDPLPGHALAVALLLIGIAGISVHAIHKRERRDLWLTAPPGSIAAIVSLTSKSGFGDLLLPYDDEKAIKRKLDGLQFRLDRRTGAIIADEDGNGDARAGPEDAMMSLLGEKHQRQSSAQFGYPDLPWEPLKTPYDP